MPKKGKNLDPRARRFHGEVMETPHVVAMKTLFRRLRICVNGNEDEFGTVALLVRFHILERRYSESQHTRAESGGVFRVKHSRGASPLRASARQRLLPGSPPASG